MTVYSFMMTGIRGNRPLDPEFKAEYMFDSFLTVEGNDDPIISVPTFPDVFFCPFLPKGSTVDKFVNQWDYPHFAIHLPNTFCELVIDDSRWGDPEFMPDYASHNEREKWDTVKTVASSLIIALRLCHYNRFINSMVLVGSTLNNLHLAPDKSIKLYPFHPISHPMCPFMEDISRSKITLTNDDFKQVIATHLKLYKLMYTADFEPVTIALGEYYNDSHPRTKMVIIWSGIECLVKPPSVGIRKALKTRISMILGKDREDKTRIFKKVAKLYDTRCHATHGKAFAKIDYSKKPTEVNIQDETIEHLGAMMDSYEILEELLWKMIHNERMYDNEELELMQEEFISEFPDLFPKQEK